MFVIQVDTFEIYSPHSSSVYIQKGDVVFTVAIFYELIVYSIPIINDIFRHVVTKNPPPYRLISVVAYHRHLSRKLVKEIFSDVLYPRPGQ